MSCSTNGAENHRRGARVEQSSRRVRPLRRAAGLLGRSSTPPGRRTRSSSAHAFGAIEWDPNMKHRAFGRTHDLVVWAPSSRFTLAGTAATADPGSQDARRRGCGSTRRRRGAGGDAAGRASGGRLSPSSSVRGAARRAAAGSRWGTGDGLRLREQRAVRRRREPAGRRLRLISGGPASGRGNGAVLQIRETGGPGRGWSSIGRMKDAHPQGGEPTTLGMLGSRARGGEGRMGRDGHGRGSVRRRRRLPQDRSCWAPGRTRAGTAWSSSAW